MKQPPETDIQKTLGIGATRNRARRKRWIIGAGTALLLLIATVIIWRMKAETNALTYITRPATRGDLVVTVTATGNLAATNEVTVGSELSGIIKTVTVDYNDPVEKGQPLARLDDIKFKAAVMKSRAALASARARLEEARATRTETEKRLARYRKSRAMTGGKLPSVEDLEAAEAALARAVAAVGVARAAIDEADAQRVEDEANLARTIIYSPVNGIVLNRDVDPGQTVAASLQSPVLFTLAEDLTRMELQVDVDEADVGQVKEGQSAEFTVDAYPDLTFRAGITQLRFGAQDTDGVVTYTAIMNVDNPDLLLRPGMTATADITVERRANALLVPNAALHFTPPQPKAPSGRGWMGAILPRPPHSRKPRASGDEAPDAKQVWVLKEGRPVPIPVTVDATDGSFTAVTGGALTTGQALVVEAVGGAS